MYKCKLHIVELEAGDFHTLMTVKIAGRSLRAVLDTGASRSCMDSVFVRQEMPELVLGLNQDASFGSGIGGNEVEVYYVNVPDFRLGRYRLPSYENLALLDFTYINQAYVCCHKKPIQMILGNDFMVRHNAIIDYKQKLLFFEK